MHQFDKIYWDSKYNEGQTGWDLSAVSPPIANYCDQIKDKNIKILIPGAGNAYEAEYLIKNGFTDITVCDIADTPIQNLKNRLGENAKKVKYLQHDYFDIKETFDLVIEQTFFCALDPKLRKKYADKQDELLNPNGKIIGVLFANEFPFDGPPFGGTKDEYKSLFENKFNIKVLADCYNSITPRAGNELFIILEKV